MKRRTYIRRSSGRPKVGLAARLYPSTVPAHQYNFEREQRIYRQTSRHVVAVARAARQYCPVMWTIFKTKVLVREVHHIQGRRRWLLNYQPWWLLVSRSGHQWIDANHDRARQRGWLCEKGRYNTQPPT